MGIIQTNSCYQLQKHRLTLDGRVQEYSSTKDLIRQFFVSIQGDLVNQRDWLFQRTLTSTSPTAVFPAGADSQFVTPLVTPDPSTGLVMNAIENGYYLQPNFIYIATDSPVSVTFGYNPAPVVWPSNYATTTSPNLFFTSATTAIGGLTWPTTVTGDVTGVWNQVGGIGTVWSFTPTVPPAWTPNYFAGQTILLTGTNYSTPTAFTVSSNSATSVSVNFGSQPSPGAEGSSGTAYLFQSPLWTTNAYTNRPLTTSAGSVMILSNTANTLTLANNTLYSANTVALGQIKMTVIFKNPSDPTQILTPQPYNLNRTITVNSYYLNLMTKNSMKIAPTTPAELTQWNPGAINGGVVGAWNGHSDVVPTFPIYVSKMSGIPSSKIIIYCAIMQPPSG